MTAMVNKIVPFLSIFTGLILTNKWQTIDIIKDINTPMLFITGK